jgi:D-alanyl-D-alanine carboxypeptidase/D-alanyl-D-alanine-endopeptidase (penicillin-binding protein 4)
VIKRLNKDSDNINAEMLLYALGYRNNAEPTSTEKGIYAVQQFISKIGLNPKEYSVVDGCGLSNQNYLTPELLVAVLKYMYKSRDFELYRQSLPIAGVDGTLRNRMKNTAAQRRVIAKTGSITGISALSGYLTASNGHYLAFSIMVQNFVDRSSFVSVNYIDKICVALAE